MLNSWRMPFDFRLADGTLLHALEAVRSLPGRRLVCRAIWNDRPVYAKLFVGNKAERDSRRDAAGVHVLTEADIPTPLLLHDGSLVDGGGRVLIFAEVVEGRSADHVLEQLAHDEIGRLGLVRRLVKTVAAHHRAGLVQQDMYPKNFLVTETQIQTLDGDAIRCYRGGVSRRASLDNLALLLSKLGVEDDAWLPQLMEEYSHFRDWLFLEADVKWLASRVMAHRLRVARGYADKKVFRSCTDIMVERTFGYFQAVVRDCDTPGLRSLLHNPDTRLQAPSTHMLKRGNTCTVVAVELDERPVVVKRYNIKNFWHGLSRAVRSTRAAASWSNAHRLKMLGILTAAPLALLERRWGPLRRQAYFIAAQVDAPAAPEFFADPQVTVERKQRVAHNIARLLHKLVCLGLVHGDMKASNVLIGSDDQPVLLDLDAMREVRCKWMLHREHAKDLRRWMQNWEGELRVSAMMREALQQVYRNHGLLQAAGIGLERSGN